MVQRKIVHFPSPALRKKARSVKRITPEIARLINDMIETMHQAPGVGLAAPQVGEALRIIVADLYKGDGPIAVVNPKIIKKAGQQEFTEGCLSLPGIEAPVRRAAQVLMKGLDKHGTPLSVEAKGLLATVFQHELDHLEGKVFIDRVEDPSLIKHVAFNKESKEELI